MSELDRCYRILGLEPDASLEDINQAYKDLVFVWHPDRVPKDNPRLLQKAEDKIKEINHARDTLRTHGRDRQAPKAQPTQPQKQASTYYQSYYYRPPQPSSQTHQSANYSQTNGHSQKDRAQTGHQANSGQTHAQSKDQNYYTQSHYRAEYHRSPDAQTQQAHTQNHRAQPTPPASPYPQSPYYPPHQRAHTP
ncbi:MAG: J domain-containing protein, partial [Phormidesmis sp. CAN_BIN44]|nr:J domain-containing protein [Phormidesmis sp. CAN_BIN44]